MSIADGRLPKGQETVKVDALLHGAPGIEVLHEGAEARRAEAEVARLRAERAGPAPPAPRPEPLRLMVPPAA